MPTEHYHRFRMAIRFGILLTWIFVSVICQRSLADDPDSHDTANYGRKLNDEERLQALDMLAKEMRENYEKIQTWKGKYRFIDGHRSVEDAPRSSDILYVAPGTSNQLNQGNIPTGKDACGGHWWFERGNLQFSLDRTKDKYRAIFDAHEPTGFLEVESGAEGWSEKRGRTILWLVADGQSISSDSQNILGGLTLPFPVISSLPENWISRVSYREPAKFGGKYFQCVPIMKFFDGDVPGRLCERLASALRGDHGDENRKTAEKQYVIYVNDESPSVYSLVLNYAKSGNRTVLVYDGKVGFNRVKLLRLAKDSKDQITLKYRKVSEVFVPEMYRHRHDKVQHGLLLPSYHRSFDFVSAELNVDIPDSEFDRKLFDFQYGERMVDETEKKLYVFDDLVGFVPAEDFRFDQSRVPRKSEE